MAQAELPPPPPPPPIEEAPVEAPPREASSGEWLSPFEDELDVPTFLRNKKEGAEDDDEERDRPAFLRRPAD
jgi:hypothetical protein